MSKFFELYGVGEALFKVLPPPIAFENAPTSLQINYEIGQVAYSPPVNPTAFYIYRGGGNWISFSDADGPILSIDGTANEITVTTAAGVSTISLPAAVIAPGSLETTTTLTAGTGITATTGDIVASAGNISATAGSVSAGTTVTGGTGVVATTGDVIASAGNIVATLGNISAAAGSVSAATTVTGASLVTSAATNGVTYTQNTITATGSDANISILSVAKGTGQVGHVRGSVGGSVDLVVTNTDNTNASSQSTLALAVGGASAGSPYVFYNISGATQWSHGPRNDAADDFYLCQGTGLASTPTLQIEKTNLDVHVNGGNLRIDSTAKQLQVKGGAATDFIGTGTLVAGELTILNTNIAAGDVVLVTRHGINGSTALGVFDVTINASVSFVIQARNPTDATIQVNDVSIVKYFIVRSI